MTSRNETVLPVARRVDTDASAVAVRSRPGPERGRHRLRPEPAAAAPAGPRRRNWRFALLLVAGWIDVCCVDPDLRRGTLLRWPGQVADRDGERQRGHHPRSRGRNVGLPHARWSEAITAFVVLRPGATTDEHGIIQAVKSVIDGYKAPKSVIVVDELPRTSTGKIQKNAVRDTYRDHYSGAGA